MHSKISGIPAEALLVRFLGLFFMIFQMNQVWGNLISSLGKSNLILELSVSITSEKLSDASSDLNARPSALDTIARTEPPRLLL